jgi:hypothetical protein
MRKVLIVLSACLWLMAIGSRADLVFSDTFENKAFVETGNPQGWTIFGAPLDDRGTLHNSQYHSATASVWVAFTWSGWGWGATTVSNEGTLYNVMNDSGSVSAWLRATNAFAAPSIAFTIYDSDGTQLRTPDAALHQPGASWTLYETDLSNMVVEAVGLTPGLNYSNVTHFGYLAFTAGQSGQNQIQYDDFNVEAIPEPATLALVVAAGLSLFVFRKGRKQ